MSDGEDYFPPTEHFGGWRVAAPPLCASLGVDVEKLAEALRFHDEAPASTGFGAALVVIHKGHVIAESYTTGSEGGPQPWTRQTCNDIKSSTKSVFGTAVGVFLKEFSDDISLETPLVGTSQDDSLIPQIWEQPLTDERKTLMKVKHALSMTSGHESREPWLAPSPRMHTPGYAGPLQMYEYSFGWWRFIEGVPAHDTLMFEPGTAFNYSNYGLELMALAMKNMSGEEVGPYVYDRVLKAIGMPVGIRENRYTLMPYTDDYEHNWSDEAGWGSGGGEGCNAYGADSSSASPLGPNSIAGSTFRCTARDFARLGYLWLRNGRWGGAQLVPQEWLRVATTRYVQSRGDSANYGFTFWIMDEVRKQLSSFPHFL